MDDVGNTRLPERRSDPIGIVSLIDKGFVYEGNGISELSRSEL
jgi:hypothetical protein